MNWKLLIGLVVAIAAFGITGAITGRPAFVTLGLAAVSFAVWVYLIWIVRKRKAGVFHDRMGPESAERRYRRLKMLLRVSGISLAVGIVGGIVHNAISAVSGTEEGVFFSIGLVGLLVFFIATFVSLIVYLRGRRRTT